ncbi:MAG: ROK family transcriptional regulator [Actinomycetaceae bacterium]|nr:ROK family transcriptional regulator [Actinomycetaceae bacterium]
MQLGSADVTRSAILTHIGANGPTSRADLARVLGVSPALITQHTRQLIDDGLVTELTHSPSQGGRPARLLGLVADAGCAIGVKVVADHVTCVEVGIDGMVSRSATQPFNAGAGTALTTLGDILQDFIEQGQRRPVLGVGVGLPADVDHQDIGTVDSTQLGWQRVPLGEYLRRHLHLPVLVENNVNALAIAEALYGKARGHHYALVVTIGTGVGAGIITQDLLLRGASGGAGEIGHLPVLEDGPLCQCGNRGCLEALIGQNALVCEGQDLGILGKSATIDTLCALADTGDPQAQEVFSRAGHLFGRTLAGVVNTLDPQILIILGEGVVAWPHWAYGFEPAFRSCLLQRKRDMPVVVETWDDDRWAQGAAALVFSTPFDTQGQSGKQGDLVRQRLAVAGQPQVPPGT